MKVTPKAGWNGTEWFDEYGNEKTDQLRHNFYALDLQTQREIIVVYSTTRTRDMGAAWDEEVATGYDKVTLEEVKLRNRWFGV